MHSRREWLKIIAATGANAIHEDDYGKLFQPVGFYVHGFTCSRWHAFRKCKCTILEDAPHVATPLSLTFSVALSFVIIFERPLTAKTAFS